jgi:hypothetical protein
MHHGITENRSLILSDRKASSNTRIHVTNVQERLERLDRTFSSFVYTSSERANELDRASEANTKIFEDVCGKLET